MEISNFRGIESLDWRIPADKKFICLIGPGDSRKSTIIDAIYYTLGDRWNLSLTDTDFFNANIEKPITVRVALGSLPAEIRSHRQLGLDLSGINAQGEWVHDPEDGYEPCVVVQFVVNEDMEPSWTLYRPDGPETNAVGAGTRRRFSVFRVDERIDNHLRWTRTSALTRLTDSSHGTSGTLATANRAARMAVAEAVTPGLVSLTGKVRERLGKLGSGDFTALQPGLDVSSSSGGGNLALFNGEVPLTNFGLGTRRLAGISTQEMAAENKSLILVDEIEHGLEPHRLVHLLKHLRSDDDGEAQVFATTHSPIAVEQLESSDLAVVRANQGQVSAAFIPSDLKFAQATLRGGPSSFLAQRIVVTEGKTEFGLLLGMIEQWDKLVSEQGIASSAAMGVAIADGGGSNAPNRAKVLRTLGYDTALFLDHDVPMQQAAVAEAEASGVQVYRWADGNATEDELVQALDTATLTDLLRLAVQVRTDEATVRSDLLNLRTNGPKVPSLNVQGWIDSGGFTLETARKLIAETARARSWFKSVDRGRLLSQFVGQRSEIFKSTVFFQTVLTVGKFVYSPVRSEVQQPARSGA